MGHTLQTLLAFLGAIGLLVSVHEFGHYLAARWLGVKVLRFSIGFGPALWSRPLGQDQTEWTLALIPLGGYVKMLDEREGPVEAHERARAFNRQSLKRRAAIVAAGPLTNLLLAVLLFAVVGMVGMPGLRPFVDTPGPGSAAERAGLRAGDLILSVNGEPSEDWQALRMQIARHVLAGDPLELACERLSHERTVLTLGAWDSQGDPDPIVALGLHPWNPNVVPRLGRILPGSAAERQGLRTGDTIVSVDGVAIAGWMAFVQVVRRHPGQSMILVFERAGETKTLALTPDSVEEAGQKIGKLGAGVALDAALQQKLSVLVRHDPLESVQLGILKTWQLSTMTLDMMGRMLSGAASTEAIGGPIQIATAAGETARLGWVPFLGFLAFLSVSLGVLNLLPVPVLDGGHLLYYSFELITGRPVPDRWVEVGTRVGMVLLFTLMALAFYNDINRFISG